MREIPVAVVGGGPAGLSAALSAAGLGAEVALFERNDSLGGQLVKQTHMFFGSKEQYAAERGMDIAAKLTAMVAAKPKIRVFTSATVLGYYEDGVLLVERDGGICPFRPQKLIVATGAAEKTLAFPNNDLPGIYGAGAVQTLMNVYGVLPGKRALMVGAGNIGVIVAYQLLQAGVEVAAVVEAAPHIGAYWVHAAKVRRAGVPILTSHTVKAAHGARQLEAVTVCAVGDGWRPVPGTEREFAVDVLCLAVGLTPLAELLWQAGCQMAYVPELGGYVPLRTACLETSVPGIYVAGDVAGVEEASSAMVEGRLAGLHAAAILGFGASGWQEDYTAARAQLAALRNGPVGEKIRQGLNRVMLGEVG